MTALSQNALFADGIILVDQQQNSSKSGSIEVFNPSTQKAIGAVPSMTSIQIQTAIDQCSHALADWSALPARKRSDILLTWSELLLKNKQQLAEIMTSEQGKVVSEAVGEVEYAASYLRWFSEEAVRVYGDIVPAGMPEQDIKILKMPIGVCAAITPWNFPLAMLARKVAAALSVGCTMIAKPSELTPFSALAFAKLGLDAGLREGVFTIVLGEGEKIGQQFCSNKKIKKLSFTGSTAVGKTLIRQSADNLQKLSLELGGNAPFIVFEDAELNSAVDGFLAAKFRNAGQTCICVNRLFVHVRVKNAVLDLLKEKIQAMSVGDGFSSADIGPLINASAVEKFNKHVADCVEKGAKILVGGLHDKSDFFVQPTLLADANCQMQFCDEESFSPIVAVIPFGSDDEVLELANSTNYGLAGYMYTNDRKRIRNFSQLLELGMLGVNAVNLSNAAAPFGGIKHSGFGREGSKYGVDDYLVQKYILESFD